MTPIQKAEEQERMEYSMYNPTSQNFKMFEQGQDPIEVGGTINVKTLLERGKHMSVERMEPKKANLMPVIVPEPTIQTR